MLLTFNAAGDALFRCVISPPPDVCGDGVMSGVEQCDDGNVASGDGCSATCQTETPPGALCGNFIVDAGETCDDGNVANGDGCSATCQLEPPIPVVGCGNGIREAGEQCDDGNLRNLDGCSASCSFEQALRVSSMLLQRTTSASCQQNAFGGAVTALAIGSIQNGATASIASGETNFLMPLLALDDLGGSDDAQLEVGVLTGMPVAGANYDGSQDLDWWYAANSASIDPQRAPTARLAATLQSGILSASSTTGVPVPLYFGGPLTATMSSMVLSATTTPMSTPLSSSGGPPGHLATTHLDPLLTTFSGLQAGSLCGNITAHSLALAAVPASMVVGPSACLVAPQTPKYTSSNSLLDVIVGGCSAAIIGNLVLPTQPDGTVPGAPLPGAGGPYTLTSDPVTHRVSICRDQSGQVVELDACLRATAYSSLFDFTANRVIIK